MRKDVRFGLTIGGCLLAILVIWAAVFDRGVSDKSTQVVVAPTQDNSPSAVQTNTPTQISESPAPSTQPAVTETNTSSTAQDWAMLLNTGGSTTQPAMLAASVPVDSAMAPPSPADSALTGSAYAPAGTATTQPSLAASGTHKIAAGESFFTIAAKVYGDGKYFTRLEEANPSVNPNKLRVGTTIVVPDLKEPFSAKVAAIAAKTPQIAVDVSKSYRVKPSDTLMAIARKLYGDGQAWQKIYDANKDVIGPNPARLKVDMVLRLPGPPTVALAN